MRQTDFYAKLNTNSQLSPCSLGLSATTQQYFSLRTNQPPATSQQYFSLKTNQHQPPAKRTGCLTHLLFCCNMSYNHLL
jgi:hypothetical protein